MCKIIGNSAYGLTAQGINEIMRYDTVSNRTVRMKDSRFTFWVGKIWTCT
jgi:hypothetical protein